MFDGTFLQNLVFIIGGLLGMELLYLGYEAVKAVVEKRKLDGAGLLKQYAEWLVNSIEQIGKLNDMSGEDKFNYVYSMMRDAFPKAPEWLLKAAIEAAVWALNKAGEYVDEKI